MLLYYKGTFHFIDLGIPLHCVTGRYAPGRAIRLDSTPHTLHRVWLRCRYATHFAALMRYTCIK